MLATLRSSCAATFLALLACGAGPAGAVDNLLRITEVMSKPSDVYATPDWFELTNYGGSAIDLTAYAVDDNSFSLGQSAFLNSTTGAPLIIQPGESIVFVEGQSTAADLFRTNWSLPAAVQVGYYAGSGLSFSSGGDGTTLFDNTDTELPGPFGGLVRVSFPAATTGRSFFWNYAADGALGSASAGTLTPTTELDPFSMSWTYTLADGITQETQYATPGKAVTAGEGIGILRWAGPAGDGGGGNWISAAPLNWRDGSTPVAWDSTSIASFPATNSTVGTVTLTESITAAELDFGKSGYTIAASSTAHSLTLNSGIINTGSNVTTTINAALEGPVGLAKTGPGVLLLGSPHNQYDGVTSVAFGTLRLTGAGVLPSTSLVSIGLTGIVDLAGRSTRIAGLQGLGDLTLGSGTLTIGIPDDADREHNGNLSGQGAVIIDSAGTGEQAFGLRTSTASKTKSYSGKTIVREGTLRISFESAPTATSGIEVEEGGRLKLSTSVDTGNYFFGINGSNDVSTAVTMLGGTLTNSEGEVTQLDNDLVFTGTAASTIEVSEENAPTPENPNVARLILAGALHGSGTAVVRGNGAVVAGADFGAYSGLESDFAGRLLVGDAAAAGKTTVLELAGSIGSGGVVVNPNGAVQAAPAVAFAAQTLELAGGELRLDADAGGVTTFNQTAVTVTADSTIAVRRAADVEATLTPSYDLPLTFSGGGVSFSAPTQAGTAATAYTARPTFSAPITLAEDATVTVVDPAAGTNHVTFAGAVADGGAGRSLTKAGVGGLTLAAANTHSGATVVQAGTLALAAGGSLASSNRVAVAAGATFDVTAHASGYVVPSGQTLAGAGTVAGGVTIGTGARLAPGASPGTLTVTQGVTWAAGGNYDWQVADAAGTAGTAGGWDLLSVGGGLNITATEAEPFRINLWTLSSTGPDGNGAAANFTATQPATWKIASAAGGISGFAPAKFQIVTAATDGTGGFANPTAGGTFSVAVSGSTDLNLVYTPGTISTPATLTWYGDGVNPGGSGAWTTSGANWHDGTSLRAWVPGAKAVFSGSAAGTVTIGAGISADGGLEFTTGGYTLGGAALTLGGTANAVSVATGAVTVAAPLAGTAGLVKTGAGTLALAAANTLSGATVVQSGSLQVSNAGAVAGSGVTVQGGAALKIDAGVTMQASGLTLAGGRLDAAGVTLAVNGTTGIAQFVIQSGSVAGSPGLAVGGGGVMTMPTDIRQVVNVASLSVDQGAGGKIDIGKGRINVAAGGTTEAELRADIIAGRSAGTFSGTSGIMTTGGKASPGSPNPVIGYRVLVSGSAIVAWAAYGDTQLDGQVNSTDVNAILNAQKFGKGASTGATWNQGDFNYSGGVTPADITLFNGANLLGKGSYLPAASTGLMDLAMGEAGTGMLGAGGGGSTPFLGTVAAVPEPATWMMAAVGMAIVAAAGRRRSRAAGSKNFFLDPLAQRDSIGYSHSR